MLGNTSYGPNFPTFLRLLWRFSPDLMAVSIGLCLGLNVVDSAYIQWLVIPFLFLFYIIIASMQRGSDRNNFSRYFLESKPMNILGYISYPLCKRTRCILCF